MLRTFKLGNLKGITYNGCFGNVAKRISRNLSNIGVSGNRSSFSK